MDYIKITSASNPKIKEALDIKNRQNKYRNNAFIIDGLHLIEMALASNNKINKVFFTDKFSSRKEGQTLLMQLSKKASEIFEVKEYMLNKLTDTETPQGIAAIASYTTKNLTEITFKAMPFLVIVDGIQEPGNLGAIIRTADAANADAVIILQGTCDVFMQKTLRATAGSIFNIPIACAETNALLKWVTSKKISLIATVAAAEKSIFDADLKKAVAFAFGNEAHGISDKIKNNADLTLRIPIIGKAESLNVAASAAICLYETIRQRISV